MRILNAQTLTGHGNKAGRRDIVEIMEAALFAVNPYNNAKKLVRLENRKLIFDCREFEPDNDPDSGPEVIDLEKIENIYVFGAAKGIQWVAKAFEDVLGDCLTGGHVIAKYGDTQLLTKIGVTYAAHPVPDGNSVAGCLKIIEYADKITERDLVITITGNGVSSLLTLPEEGISLEDVRRLTYMMQIEKGVSTIELNTVRNHVDQLKGGKLSSLFKKSRMIHIAIIDPNHHVVQDPRHDYIGLMRNNVWLHNLPDSSTFDDAILVLHRYGAWDECPLSIRTFLTDADPAKETVKYEDFTSMRFRVFGIMPSGSNFIMAGRKKAEELGYKAVTLSQMIMAEAQEAGKYAGAIANNIEIYGEPFKAPIALFSTGEMLVTVARHKGIGGRNQEFALSAAMKIAGTKHIVIGSADTDGTDGPGGFVFDGAPKCLGGGIVDGETAKEASALGIDILEALLTHSTSEALWKLGCGIHMEQCISLVDLTVILVK